jgi:molecular chaperone DnaJ
MHVAAHEFFHREEHDIHCRMNLTFSQAALGAKIQVPLLDEGKTQIISVPAGVQSNDTHRIPGVGIPQLRGHRRGDQVIHFIIETPKHLNKKQKELFQELAEIEGNPIKETLKGFFQKLGI